MRRLIDVIASLSVARDSIHHANDLSTIRRRHTKDLDLNLLRIFDAVYRQRSVSRAAEALVREVAQPRWGLPEFGVCLHWSARAQNDPANRWLRELAIQLFREPVAAGATAAAAAAATKAKR